MKPRHEPESDADLEERIVAVTKLTASGSWPWLGDLRAAGERRGVKFVQIVAYFEAHPQLLDKFVADCIAGHTDLAVLEVLDAIMA